MLKSFIIIIFISIVSLSLVVTNANADKVPFTDFVVNQYSGNPRLGLRSIIFSQPKDITKLDTLKISIQNPITGATARVQVLDRLLSPADTVTEINMFSFGPLHSPYDTISLPIADVVKYGKFNPRNLAQVNIFSGAYFCGIALNTESVNLNIRDVWAVKNPTVITSQVNTYLLKGYKITPGISFSEQGASAGNIITDPRPGLEFKYSTGGSDWGFVSFSTPDSTMDLTGGIRLSIFGPLPGPNRLKELGITLVHADSSQGPRMPIHSVVNLSDNGSIDVDFSDAQKRGLDLTKIIKIIFYVGKQFQDGQIRFNNLPGERIYIDTVGLLK
jgi:hypothetical protein